MADWFVCKTSVEIQEKEKKYLERCCGDFYEKWRLIDISTKQEVMVENKLCKIRRIKISNFEKIETEKGRYKIVVRMYPFKENKSKIFIDDSELTRIIKHLNPTDNCHHDKEKYEYIKDLISIKVGRSGKYKMLIEDGNNRTIENIGELEIYNYSYDVEEKEYYLDSVETFVHLISNASHIRSQKALFVSKKLFTAIDEILRCGVDPETKTKYISKWTSYYGLQASNSVVVTMPKCVIIPDLRLNIEDIFDVVRQEYKNGFNAELEEIDKFKYDVREDVKTSAGTCPFDGMGAIDVEMAAQWAKDLGLDYVPGSFQIRLCGVKGCLFVMPIKEFVDDISKTGKIIDIDGNTWDYENGDFNVILTDSMFKYKKFYNEENKAAQWKREFEKEVHGYKRTFNICSFASKYDDLKDELLAAYQPLQTMDELFDLEEEERQNRLDSLCGKTVETVKSMYSDIFSFLKYIGIDEEGEVNKESVKPYYRALAVNHSLCNDRYIRMKMERTLKAAKEKTYIGKLYMNGNYTVVGSDPYALLQHAFGLEITGLLDRDEIYSNYWNKRDVKTVTIWRNPHIFREHWIGKCVDNNHTSKWFRYLNANIIVSVWDTNLLRCNSADTDGDTLASVKNDILEGEVERMLQAGKARTIYPDLLCDRKSNDDNIPEVCISDTKAIIESEIRGFRNDIGEVVNKISELWGEKQDGTTQKYIKILSVVGSLVIDFVKTGVKIPIPQDIVNYIKKNRILKLRFMMYLPNNKKARKKEEKARLKYDKKREEAEKKGEKFDQEFKSKFSDKECTMNSIMKYMKDNLDGLEITINESDFDYKTLIKSRDHNLDKKTQYVKIRDLFKKYVMEQKGISDERKKEEDKYAKVQEEYNMIYKAFYDKCRNELLSVTNEKGKVCTKNMILDCCIVCCYTEFKEENYSHFDLLWNLFPEELVKRAGGKEISQMTRKTEDEFEEFLEKKKETSKAKYDLLRQDKSNKIQCLECKSGTPDNFSIYKSDIAEIKDKIPTSFEDYICARKVYFSYFVAYKRLKSMNKPLNIPCTENSRNCITFSYINKITGLGDREVKKAVETLQNQGIIKYHSNKGSQTCELLFVPERNGDDKLYYYGINYLKAFRVMNRYLSR